MYVCMYIYTGFQKEERLRKKREKKQAAQGMHNLFRKTGFYSLAHLSHTNKQHVKILFHPKMILQKGKYKHTLWKKCYVLVMLFFFVFFAQLYAK